MNAFLAWLQGLEPLIAADDYWTLWMLIITGTTLSIWLEQTYRWAAGLSGPVIAIGLAMVLSTCRIMPTESPAYTFCDDYLVPLAIPLLLFRASLVRILRTTGKTFVAVNVAAVGTMLGALAAAPLLRGRMSDVHDAAGIMTASYIGGMVNMQAVYSSLHASKSMFSALIVADNVVMAGFFLLLLRIAVSRYFLRRFPHPHIASADVDSARAAASHWDRKGISLLDVARSLAFAFAVVGVAMLVRGQLLRLWPAPEASTLWTIVHELVTNKFVLLTSFSLAGATLLHRPLMAVHGAEELGGFILYIFLFVIGLPADIVAVVRDAPLLFVFCTIIAVANLGLALLVGRLLRLDLEDILIASNATLGGPTTAAAMAISKGWNDLVLPALLVGLWGYVIGTPCGLFIAWLVKKWLTA